MLNRFWTLGLPLLILIIQIGMEMSFSSQELATLMSENGPIETLQWMAIGGALVVAVMLLFRINPNQKPFLFGWVLIAALACLYVTGEEVSWGQHFLHWNTPEYWQQLNDQQETNLHNTSSWLDQKPRLILFIGIIAGGIIIPLMEKYKPHLLPARFAVIYPPIDLMPVAFLVLGPYLAQEISKALDISLFERVSEVQELYMFYFVLLYLLVLRRRNAATV